MSKTLKSNFYTYSEIQKRVNTANCEFLFENLTKFILFDGMVKFVEFDLKAIDKKMNDLDEAQQCITDSDFYLPEVFLFDNFEHSYHFYGFFELVIKSSNEENNLHHVFFKPTENALINGQTPNFKKCFLPIHPIDFYDSIKGKTDMAKLRGSQSDIYSLVKREIIFNKIRPNCFHYHFLESEIEKVCISYGLNFKAKSPAASKKTIDSRTLTNHGAVVYALAKANSNVLKENGSINQDAICNLVIDTFKDTEYQKSHKALQRVVSKLISEVEDKAGIKRKMAEEFVNSKTANSDFKKPQN